MHPGNIPIQTLMFGRGDLADQMIVCDESEQDVLEISGVIGWSKENKLKSSRGR